MKRQRGILVAIAVFLTLGSGLINLYSVMHPAVHSRMLILRDVFPFEFVHLSRVMTLLIGFGLIVSSLNLYKRKRRAYTIVLALSILSLVFHLTKGLDYEEAFTSLLLAGVLLATSSSYNVRSSIPRWRNSLVRLTLGTLVGLVYGVAGFWFLDPKEFGLNFNIWDSIHRTLLFFSLVGDPGIVPHTRHAVWFLDSLYLMTATVIAYALVSLYRPAIYHFRTLPQERALASRLVEQYGAGPMDFFKLWPDKSYFFNSKNNCFIAYRVSGNFAIVLADPVGPEGEVAGTIEEFRRFCRQNDWRLGFHQVPSRFLPLYRQLGFRKLKIGDVAYVDVAAFTLDGKAMRAERSKVKQLEKQGIQLVRYPAPVPEAVLDEAKLVSDEWLNFPGRRERQFTLGTFEREYVRSTPMFAARDAEGKMLGFVNLVPCYREGEASIDLMRRRAEVPNGVMDFLFIRLLLELKKDGYTRFDFGMAPMSGFLETEDASREERAVHYFFQRLNFLFSYSGLRAYKAKFASYWEPRYMVYRQPLDLAKLAITLNKVSAVHTHEPRIRPVLKWRRMIPPRREIAAAGLLALLLLTSSMQAEGAIAGVNQVTVRGQQQQLWYYPAAGRQPLGTVLFAPGDGGWRGFAITIAQKLTAQGFEVYGFDTKRYLESFTGKQALQPSEVTADMQTIGQWIQRARRSRVTLVGWSEGAGLCLLGAQDAKTFDGLITIGLPDSSELAWHWADAFATLRGGTPNEPMFPSADYLPRSVVPLVMIQSTGDEFVPVASAQHLFQLAKEPKQYLLIKGGNHKFDGNTAEFFTKLGESILWVKKQ